MNQTLSSPPEPIIKAISEAISNAELMVHCRELGYLNDEMRIADVTYGKGRFWKLWRPANLTTSDIDPKSGADVVADLRNLPCIRHYYDALVLDPPYKLNGTGGSHASDEAYGTSDKWGSGAYGRLDLYDKGIVEAKRVLGRKGILLVKAMDQVVGGKYNTQTKDIWAFATMNGFNQVDELLLINNMAQPERGTCDKCGNHVMLRSDDIWRSIKSSPCAHPSITPSRQQHARRNYSTLMVFEKRSHPDDYQ